MKAQDLAPYITMVFGKNGTGKTHLCKELYGEVQSPKYYYRQGDPDDKKHIWWSPQPELWSKVDAVMKPSAKENNEWRDGFGVQCLSNMVNTILINPNQTIFIEYPETGLHPSAQVELGDFFIGMSRRNRFVLETHSEQMLLRILRRIREGYKSGHPSVKTDDVKVLVLDSDHKIHNPPIDEDGDFCDEWPNGFFEERYDELF